MGSLVTLRRHAFPLLERRILDRFGSLPLLGALRPAHFSSLVARVSYGVVRNCKERAFLLSKAKYVSSIESSRRRASGLVLAASGVDAMSHSRNPGQRSVTISIRQSGIWPSTSRIDRTHS